MNHIEVPQNPGALAHAAADLYAVIYPANHALWPSPPQCNPCVHDGNPIYHDHVLDSIPSDPGHGEFNPLWHVLRHQAGQRLAGHPGGLRGSASDDVGGRRGCSDCRRRRTGDRHWLLLLVLDRERARGALADPRSITSVVSRRYISHGVWRAQGRGIRAPRVRRPACEALLSMLKDARSGANIVTGMIGGIFREPAREAQETRCCRTDANRGPRRLLAPLAESFRLFLHRVPRIVIGMATGRIVLAAVT